MSQVDDFLLYQFGCAARGVRYRAIAGRCDPDQTGYTDCSGLQIAAMHHVGLPTPEHCMNSGEMYQWCRSQGTLMSIPQARVTRGAWLFVGYQGNHHVAVSLGDGRQFAAHSPTIGLGAAPFSANAWSAAGWPPGLRADAASSPPPPSTGGLPVPLDKQTQDELMLIDVAAVRTALQSDYGQPSNPLYGIAARENDINKKVDQLIGLMTQAIWRIDGIRTELDGMRTELDAVNAAVSAQPKSG